MSTSEGQHRWGGFIRKHEARDELYWEKDAEVGTARKDETCVYGHDKDMENKISSWRHLSSNGDI